MSKRRVVISGIGAITPIGATRDGLWEGLRAKRSAVRSLTRFDPSIFRSHNAAEVPDFVAGDHLENKRAKRLDRFGQFSVIAARMAVEDAELNLAAEDRERIGAMMGTALGGVGYAEEQSPPRPPRLRATHSHFLSAPQRLCERQIFRIKHLI